MKQTAWVATLALATNLQHAINALFKIGAVTIQALLQHLFHALRPLNQRVHLAQLLLCQVLPARGKRRVPVQFVEQQLHLGDAKAN